MKLLSLSAATQFVALLLSVTPLLAKAESSSGKLVPCPVVVDRESGKYSSSRAKYRCYSAASSARRAGFSRHSFSDDSSCVPTPAPTPSGGGVSGNYLISGPGQAQSVVFSAPSGGMIAYSFPGGGKFEIKVLSASSGKRLEQVLETTQAGQSSISFTAQSAPIVVKAEGPGAWSVGITVN